MFKKFLMLFVLVVGTCVGGFAAARNVDPSFQTRIEQSGVVKAIAVQSDGKLIVAGDFAKFDERLHNDIVRLNEDGSFDSTFDPGSGSNGTIDRVVVQADGKILICGTFSAINGVARNKFARLNANGSLDTAFDIPANELGASGSVQSIVALADGKILVGGVMLTTFNGTSYFNIWRLNQNGSLDPTFRDSDIATSPGGVLAIVLLPDGKLLVGGTFFWKYIKLNSNGSRDLNYNPDGRIPDSNVTNLVLQSDGRVLVCGNFSRFVHPNGSLPNANRSGIARLSSNGSIDLTFDTGSEIYSPLESAFAQSDNKVIIAGSGNRTLARLNSDGSLDLSYTANRVIDGNVNSLVGRSDGSVLVGGSFTRFSAAIGTPDPVYRNGIGRILANGAPDNTFDPGTGAVLAENEAVVKIRSAKAEADGKILIAGKFNLVNGRGRPNFALLNADGTIDESFYPKFPLRANPPQAEDMVYSIARTFDGKIVIGGLFGSYGGDNVPSLLRFLPNGDQDTSFVSASNILPLDLAPLPDGRLVAVGLGTFGNIICLNPNGNFDPTFNAGSGANGQIRTIALTADNGLLIGGDFTTFNTNPRQRIAKLNLNGSLDFNFLAGTSADAAVNKIISQSDGKVLLGGDFTLVRGVSRNKIARLEADGSMDNTFDPGIGFDGSVRSMSVSHDGKLVVGGTFTFYNGNQIRSVARLNANGTIDTTFSTGIGTVAPTAVQTVAVQPNGKVIAAGDFVSFNSQLKLKIARLRSGNDSRAPFDLDGDGLTDLSIFRPSVGQWWHIRSSNGGSSAAQFGNSSDQIVPADFTGDGKTDIAFYRPSSGQWFVLRSEDSSFYALPFGISTDVPAPADYDGDGKADVSVFRPSSATWYIQRSAGGTDIMGFGNSMDKPVPADYDGDGKADVAIFRAGGTNGAEWWIRRSSNGSVYALAFGNSTDKAVPGDYTGDGKIDVAMFRPSNGNWFILRSEDLSYFAFPFGTTGDLPTPGDYDGDGRWDAAVFRPSNANWFVQRSTAGTLIQQFGTTGDRPLANAFVP